VIDISHIITLVLALLGWLIVHRLNAERDLKNKKREIRTQMLIEAYKHLSIIAGPKADVTYNAAELFSILQLIGTRRQVDLLYEMNELFAIPYRAERSAKIEELVAQLVMDLRRELNLEQIDVDKLKFVPYCEDANPKWPIPASQDLQHNPSQ